MRYNPEQSNVRGEIHHGATIHSHVWIGDQVKIQSGTKVQAFAFIPNGVHIGKNVFIGPHVCFTNDKYPPKGEWRDTFVCDDVVIGAGAVILPGVCIGKGAIIGAGSVVTKHVPDGETWIGNPARKYEQS